MSPEEQKQYDRVCRERFDRVDSGIAELKTLLVGDISGNMPGLLERVRQVEQARAGLARLGWIAVTAAVVAVVGLIVKLVVG